MTRAITLSAVGALIIGTSLTAIPQDTDKPAELSADEKAVVETAESFVEAFNKAVKAQQDRHDQLLKGDSSFDENPYLIHQELGDIMTRVATVVRRNDQLTEAIGKVNDLHERSKRVSLSDTGHWSNQNVIFAKSVQDMFPIAKTILKGALQRDECRGAHFKPDFQKQSLTAEDHTERLHQAEKWCDEFHANNQKYLKSTVATWQEGDSMPSLNYESVDTSLIPPRPRLYGLVGAEVIEEVWNQRAKAAETAPAETVAAT